MKILIVSDIHYSLKQFDWLLKVAHKFDLIVIAGDLLDVGGGASFDAQIIVVIKYITRLQSITQLILCSGNHDLDSRDGDGEKISNWMNTLKDIGVFSDGDGITIDRYFISIFPWWDGPNNKSKISRQIELQSRQADNLHWVWIHHAPPSESATSWSGKASFGDNDILQQILRYSPEIIISGHIHQSPFAKAGSWIDKLNNTWCFNAGRQIGVPPAFIALNLEIDEAVWITAMGAELVFLNSRLSRPIAPLRDIPSWLDFSPNDLFS